MGDGILLGCGLPEPCHECAGLHVLRGLGELVHGVFQRLCGFGMGILPVVQVLPAFLLGAALGGGIPELFLGHFHGSVGNGFEHGNSFHEFLHAGRVYLGIAGGFLKQAFRAVEQVSQLAPVGLLFIGQGVQAFLGLRIFQFAAFHSFQPFCLVRHGVHAADHAFQLAGDAFQFIADHLGALGLGKAENNHGFRINAPASRFVILRKPADDDALGR